MSAGSARVTGARRRGAHRRTGRGPGPVLAAALVAAVVLAAPGVQGRGDAADPGGDEDPVRDDGLIPAPEHLPQTPRVDLTPRVLDLGFPLAAPLDEVRFSPDDFTALRGGGTRLHAATDLMAPKHHPVHAVVGGHITFAPYPEPSYGWMVSIRGDDGARYAYVHLNNDTPARDADGRWLDDDAGGVQHAYAPRIVAAIREHGPRGAVGLRIERGELIGWVGDSGNAKGTPPHLHLEIHLSDEHGEYRIPPYPSLRAALERGEVPPAGPPVGQRPGVDDPPAPRPVPEPEAEPTGPRFDDVDPGGTHAGAIARMAARGVVVGCDDARYCPHVPVTRGELASALAAALELPGSHREARADTGYLDVARADADSAAIAAVTDAGLLRGYGEAGARRFHPHEPLTRAQLASVLVAGFAVPPAPGPAPFVDVPAGGVHSRAIAAASAAGLTRGCDDAPRYCGADPVTRAQIASFLDQALSSG